MQWLGPGQGHLLGLSELIREVKSPSGASFECFIQLLVSTMTAVSLFPLLMPNSDSMVPCA